MEAKSRERRIVFQSLFQWIVPSNTDNLLNLFLQFLFQSLFQWIVPSNKIFLNLKILSQSGFNPCFSGLFPQTIFISLDSFLPAPCFNPCFSGLFPQTKKRVKLVDLEKRVSILVLVDCSLKQMFLIDNPDKVWGFQSLFQWIVPSNLLSRSFNSS